MNHMEKGVILCIKNTHDILSIWGPQQRKCHVSCLKHTEVPLASQKHLGHAEIHSSIVTAKALIYACGFWNNR